MIYFLFFITILNIDSDYYLYIILNVKIIDFKKYNQNLKLEYIGLIIVFFIVFINFNEDSLLKGNNQKLFRLHHFHYAVLLIFRSQPNLCSSSVQSNEPYNNKDIINIMENLPIQQTTNDPLIDEFFNGTSFNT